MKQLYLCLTQQHDLRLVALAAVICALGAHSTFAMGRQVFRCRNMSDKLPWAVGGVLGTAAAIWATHFIAMLAFEPGMASGFDVVTTAMSFAIAFLVVGLGAGIVMARPGRIGRLIGGGVGGLAISAMHYTGMMGYRVQGHVDWDRPTLLLSILTGALLSAIAVDAGFSPRRTLRRAAPVFLLLAVCGTHFIGMSAMSLRFDPRIAVPDGIDGVLLTILVVNAAALILGLTFGSLRLWLASRRRREAEDQRLREFADIAVEGLAICHDGRIENLNRSLANILCAPQTSFIGRTFDTLLPSVQIDEIPRDVEIDADLHAADGQVIPVRIVARPISLGAKPRTVVAIRDQRERLRSEAAMHALAHQDALTGLANRRQFNEALRDHLRQASETGPALLAVDLDRFKQVNDTLGHTVGDEVLQRVAKRIIHVMGDDALVARLGGDEFAIVKHRFSHLGDVQSVAECLIDVLGRPYLIGGQIVDIGASIGIAIAPRDGNAPDDLIRNADLALYRAKTDGRGRYRLFESAMNDLMQARRALQLDLRQALARHEFELFHQPLVDARTGEYCGAEALIRWRHPERGLVSPAEFIPLAEETGLIVGIGEWVLRAACHEAMTWNSHLTIAVNLSPVQFRDARLVSTVKNILSETGLPGERLELEITESTLLLDETRTLTILQELKALGIRISMDDFGTGYSSLSYLRRFPFDKIKIDQSFVRQAPNDRESVAIIRAIAALGSSLGIKTTAEGVETLAQSQLILAEGCDQLQGYLYSKPLPANQIFELFSAPRAVASVA